RRLLAVPWEGGAVTPLADLPAPIVFGAGGPDGVHVLVHGDGGAEGWLIPASGTPRLESTGGLVIPAPQGGFRLLGVLSGSRLLRGQQEEGLRRVALMPGEHLLDLGCGTGRALQLRADAFGADASLEMLRQAPRGKVVCAHAGELPFRSASFNAVLCTNSF